MRVVVVLAGTLVALAASAQSGHAQRSGTMQVTARVVDTRAAAPALAAVQRLAATAIAGAPVHAGLAQVRIEELPPIRPIPGERPTSTLRLTVNYLRN